MIPLCLRLSGFLSYREPVELDFSSFDLACISGPNGAGKSTLLDAMTWALFGQARKRDDTLVNLQSKAAEVALTFRYEGAVYRVQRSLTRGKTATLEFQVQRPESRGGSDQGAQEELSAEWRPLTERTLRDTQARIESVLRLDYDTFINAAFFLQGKADQFAQQTPARRKEVLSSILGLESWDEYRSRASARRHELEEEVAEIDGRRTEIAAELAEEMPRRQRLQALEAESTRTDLARRSQESAVESARTTRALLERERQIVEGFGVALERSRSQLESLKARLEERDASRRATADLTLRANAIRAAFAAWQAARSTLENWEGTATNFHQVEQRRRPLVETIGAERARLEEELRSLTLEQQEMDEQAATIRNLEPELQGRRAELAEAEDRVAKRNNFQVELVNAREAQAGLKAENESLRQEMEALRVRIETLETTEGAECPLCGQPLSAGHRKSTLNSMRAEGKQRGDRFRANKAKLEDLAGTIEGLERRLAASSSLEDERLERAGTLGQLSERLEGLRRIQSTWESTGMKRLAKVQDLLDRDHFALEARKELKQLDKELAGLGYDAAGHDAARRLEAELRPAEQDHRSLETAAAALIPLEDEVNNLRAEIGRRSAEIAEQESEFKNAQQALEATARQAPNLDEAEQMLFELQEQQNALNREIGAARQKVTVLDELRLRDGQFQSTRQALALQIGRHRVLERAFGKDGVPALLIEQALPEIESRANELLDRLSDGRMSVRFVTQAGYKDRKREDLRETLDIQISDGAGMRDYELYSGGEAFRINFAVRLALSQVLAARKGARLQTLVIDEGFGSQDEQGRQRLIEAITLVKDDFALVLVITHLEQLKDAFPTRIEVEKTAEGSHARIV